MLILGYCPSMKLISFLGASLLLTVSLQGATLVSLDSSNGFSADVDSQFTLTRPSMTGGPVFVTNGQFLGVNFSLLPTPMTSLQAFGNGIMAGDIFLIEANATGDQFNAELVFFTRPNASDLGAIPATITADTVGAVFEVSPVPEPSTSVLLLSLAGLAMRRRRS